jgi:hypothetical protein
MPISLTEQQFFDYIFCPAKYDLKYNKKIVIEEPFSINNILNTISKFFYMYIVNNMKTPSMNTITTKFDSLMKPYMDITSNKQYTDALFQLRNFYNWACSNRIAVIDSDIKYIINHKDIILEGIMSPVAINENKRLEFLIMNFSSRTPDQLEIDTKLKYSIDMMSFNESNKDNKIFATKVHCVKSGKDFITSRTDNDYNRLTATIEGVAAGINNKAFYPRESHMCQNCSYKNCCRGWK